jgi:hypothetical protein
VFRCSGKKLQEAKQVQIGSAEGHTFMVRSRDDMVLSGFVFDIVEEAGMGESV